MAAYSIRQTISAGDRLVAVSDERTIVGLDPVNGQRLWEVGIDELTPADDGAMPGSSFENVTAANGSAIVTTESTILALDAQTGRIMWHLGDDDAPQFGVLAGAVDFVYHAGVDPSRLVARRRGTGVVSWTAPVAGSALTSAPTSVGNRIISATAEPTGQLGASTAAVEVFDGDGESHGRIRIDGAPMWQVAGTGRYLTVATDVVTDPSKPSTSYLTRIDLR